MILTQKSYAIAVVAELSHNMGTNDIDSELFGSSGIGFSRSILLGLISLAGLLTLLGLYGVYLTVSSYSADDVNWTRLLASLLVTTIGFAVAVGMHRQFTLMEQLNKLLPRLEKDHINSVLVQIISNDPSKDMVSMMLTAIEKIFKNK